MKRYIGIGMVSVGIIVFLIGLGTIVLYVLSSGVPVFYGIDSWKDLNPKFLFFIVSNILYVVGGFILFLAGINALEKNKTMTKK